MNFPEFLAKWTTPGGQRIDYDHVYEYQCVDLILEYAYECGGLASGVRGNAVDYWNKPTAVMLTRFVKIPTQDPQAGDITVLTSPITSLGHIGIATGAVNGGQFQMMEQNGSTGNGSGLGADAVRTRFIPKSRIIGVLRLTSVAPPANPMISFDQLTQVFQSQLNRAPDPGAVAHYVGHYTYDFVVSDVSNSAEWHSVHDPKPAPPPAAPVPVPANTEPYTIRTTIKKYGNKTDAMNHTNSIGDILAGAVWYKYYDQDGMFNLTQVPGQSTGTWINPVDNVPWAPPVVPEPTPVPPEPAKPAEPIETTADIRASFIPLLPDGSPIECEVLKTFLLVDTLGIGEAITVNKDRIVQVYGTFVAAERVYALVKVKDRQRQNLYMYGVPVAARDNFAPFLDDIYKLGDHVKKSWELFYDKHLKSLDGIFRIIGQKIKNL